MGSRIVNRGEVSRTTAERVRHLRVLRGLSFRQFAAALTRAGHPMVASGLAKIEAGQRRVDVQDLVVFARVLGVSPTVLLGLEDLPSCGVCSGLPPAGFTCNACGKAGS